MSALNGAITVIWITFWVYWFLAAATAKRSSGRARRLPPGIAVVLLVFLGTRVFGSFDTHGLAGHAVAVKVLGVALFVCGLALAVWARIYLGRNWGMPMTEKDEPELVTGGPYRLIRHPIYTGILAGMLGTAIASNAVWLVILLPMAVYFLYCARVEERHMTRAFPSEYPRYRARTRMLIPFVL